MYYRNNKTFSDQMSTTTDWVETVENYPLDINAIGPRSISVVKIVIYSRITSSPT